ncbi:thioredoxin h [Gamsiella multidivaricata]|uniref:thioredoxin h n=1 Tax=Gamsiella multidivaricata TaxID=101098 RepID=UPI0022202EEF|nr:thioredoxin h [Gamsiella multidivaricata]KAG0368802.1 hypothetical protein BGZ54_001117 [Gamsiella multidivaricata]KAI7817462.1 thioredoxin h [Gamsiella multidivaricata]
MVKEIDTAETFNGLISSGKVIVDYHAQWCGPCKVIGPVFEAQSTKFPDINFVKVNVDNLGDISASAGVRAMPTFQTYKDGVKIGEVLGANQKALLDLIQQLADA